MRDEELIELIYLLFGIGIVLAVYYPGAWDMLIQMIALVGAFYFLWGIFKRVTSFLIPGQETLRDDWWNGVAILSLVLLIFGRTEIPFAAIEILFDTVSSILGLFI